MKEAEDPKTEYFAQFGEDRILEEIFRRRSKGYCVEVGANDGILDSMTYRFESMGWTCLLVEPIPELFRKIMENRNCIAKNYAASSIEGEASFFVAEEAIGMSALELTRTQRKNISRAGGTLKEIRVRKKTLDSILEESNFDAIDFISIDVEGHEMEVLKGFSLEKYRPRIVLIEDNSNQTDPTVQKYMKSKGYELFSRTGVNDWYASGSDGELISPKRVEAFLEERAKAYLANKIALLFPLVLPVVPDSIKAFLKKLIRLLSPCLDRIRWRRKESGPGKGDAR